MSEPDVQQTHLTAGRIAAALAAGAVAGGLSAILLFAASGYLLPGAGAGLEARRGLSSGVLGTWSVLALLSVLTWAAGLLVIGGPAWFLMHRSGLRARFHAMVLGALLAGAAGYILGVFARAPFPAAWFLAFALIGLEVGWLIWSLCYGRKSRRPAPAE